MIYGDPFDPGELDNEFWNNFESSLANIDTERINLFFGKERRNLKDMRRSIRNDKKNFNRGLFVDGLQQFLLQRRMQDIALEIIACSLILIIPILFRNALASMK